MCNLQPYQICFLDILDWAKDVACAVLSLHSLLRSHDSVEACMQTRCGQSVQLHDASILQIKIVVA